MSWLIALITLYIVIALTVLGATTMLDADLYDEIEWFFWPWFWPLMPIRLAIYVLQLRRKRQR